MPRTAWNRRLTPEIDVEKLGRYLYQGAEVYLERKFALIEEYL